MAGTEPEMPHTQTSAPVKPARTTEDGAVPRREPPDDAEAPRRGGGDETGEHGDRMPKGADEPGAGL
jgi:hypothetical protein